MGRTVTAYSMVIDQVIRRFDSYRRTLRREDREAFDDLMRIARMQVQAGVMAQHPNAFDSMSMAMLIHLQRQITELKKEKNFKGELYEEKTA
jgi:hypothetical protein